MDNSKKPDALTEEEKDLINRLRANPLMASGMAEVMARLEAELANGADAHQAEEAAIEVLQKLGQSMLKQWAQHTESYELNQSQEQHPKPHKHAKKKLSWHSTFGDISLMVQVLRRGRRGKTFCPFCPFCQRAKVSNRGCSRILQRRIVDFYIERSGQKTQRAMREHYGIEVSLHAIQEATAQAAARAQLLNSQQPANVSPTSELLVVEADGSMVPIIGFHAVHEVKEIPAKLDRRKRRHCHWKELRLCTAHDPKRQHPRYGVARGTPLEVGCMIYDTCRFEGMTKDTRIHAVADGAPWIAAQFEEQFGTNHTFLIDYYHASEYLAEASSHLGMSETQRKQWYQQHQDHLRESRADLVVQDLQHHLAQQDHPLADDHPVVKAQRYLSNRLDHLDYASALRENLPIGSGEVESAHRSVLQDRLKIAGAWWLLKTAEEMAHLRVLRANSRWEELWSQNQAA